MVNEIFYPQMLLLGTPRCLNVKSGLKCDVVFTFWSVILAAIPYSSRKSWLATEKIETIVEYSNHYEMHHLKAFLQTKVLSGVESLIDGLCTVGACG